jgi:methylenetetrahydrofolate reductase (NADPH)
MTGAAGPVVAAGCPKRMVFGPCGGVGPDGGCEVLPVPCVFDRLVRWPGPDLTTPVPTDVPTVLIDFSVPPFDRAAVELVAGILVSACDAVLVGEHQDRPDFPPAVMGGMLRAAGLRPWLTLACRDRNRIVLDQELRALADAGLAEVLCVTGDARAYDIRPDVTQVFDLDGTRLAALAASLGLTPVVAETPLAPPRASRC